MKKGTVEYEDVILPITDISLKDGAFLVTAKGLGPMAGYRGPARIYGPDGLLVQTGGWIECPAVKAGQEMTLECTMTLESPVTESVPS